MNQQLLVISCKTLYKVCNCVCFNLTGRVQLTLNCNGEIRCGKGENPQTVNSLGTLLTLFFVFFLRWQQIVVTLILQENNNNLILFRKCI